MVDPNKNRITAIFGTNNPEIKRPTKVNFRIDEKLWEAFRLYAEAERTDRSSIIVKFIEDCTRRN
jgi:hypothetical protein